MTPNTSPKKSAWFALTENSAASAQVCKVDKKLPATTAIVALAIVAFGTFFANGSMNSDSSPTNNLGSTSMSTVTSGDVAQTTAAVTETPVQNAQAVKSVKVVAPQSMNGIADPTLNGGGDDDEDDEDDEDVDDEDDDEDDDRN